MEQGLTNKPALRIGTSLISLPFAINAKRPHQSGTVKRTISDAIKEVAAALSTRQYKTISMLNIIFSAIIFVLLATTGQQYISDLTGSPLSFSKIVFFGLLF